MINHVSVFWTFSDTANSIFKMCTKIPALRRGSRHKVLPLTKKLFTMDTRWEKKYQLYFFQWSIATKLKGWLYAHEWVCGQQKTDFRFCVVFLFYFWFGLVWLSWLSFVLIFVWYMFWFLEREYKWGVGREIGRIWEELEGKKQCYQNILHENV